MIRWADLSVPSLVDKMVEMLVVHSVESMVLLKADLTVQQLVEHWDSSKVWKMVVSKVNHSVEYLVLE